MPMYEDLKLRREGEREGEGVYIQETRSCDATRDSSLSGDKLARHRPSAVTMPAFQTIQNALGLLPFVIYVSFDLL